MPENEAKTQPEKPKTLIQKLAEIVSEIDNVDKRGRNEFQKYAYVKAADVAWMVRKALSARNIYLTTDVVEIRNYEIPAKEGHMQAVDVRMEFSFFDGDAPETPPVVIHSWGTGTDKGDKAVYKAMTGALKYGLRHAFLIPDESDPEADAETDRATAASKAVGEAKVAALKGKAGKSPANGQESLFYVEPPSHNGHFVEFLNLREFVGNHKEIEDTLLLLFSNSKGKRTKDGTTLVPSENVPSLLEKLAGDYGLTIKKLEAPANA
jgi:hypothetical protein